MMRRSWFPLLAALLLATAGCSALSKDKPADSSPPPKAGKSDQAAPIYLDFDDVLIPGEMEIDRDESFVYQTSGFTVGSLSLKGRVEVGSLIAFFEKNMPRDNWRMVSQFKSPQRTMMLLQKQNRWCVLEISEGAYNTYAKVWVSPTINPTAGGLVK
jgi:hypothetical protein